MTRARDVANLIGSGNYSSTTFTATAGQTAFSIAHTQNFVQVFMNGLLLDLTTDYTSNGSAITLTSGAAAGDEIEVVKYNTFSVGDAITQTAADTRYVNTTGDSMTGNLGVKATLKTTHADADVVQFGGTGYLANWEDAETYLAENLYVNSSGAYKYLTTSHASLYSQTTGKHQFKVAPSGSADGTPTLTTGLEIDNAGRVLKPVIPYGQSSSQTKATVTSGSAVKIQLDHDHKSGGGLTIDGTNERMTVPVDGLYVIGYTQLADVAAYTEIYIAVNGTMISGSKAQTGTSHQYGEVGSTILKPLSANDYVEWWCAAGATHNNVGYNNHYVYLLG